MQYRLRHPTCRNTDWDGTCGISNGCVDAYEAASAIQQHTPRVAWIDSCVCLNDIANRHPASPCAHQHSLLQARPFSHTLSRSASRRNSSHEFTSRSRRCTHTTLKMRLERASSQPFSLQRKVCGSYGLTQHVLHTNDRSS